MKDDFKLTGTFYFDGSITESAIFNPDEFLYCEDEEELREAVEDAFYQDCEGDFGDVNCNDIYERDFEVPQEFINRWKELKEEEDEAAS